MSVLRTLGGAAQAYGGRGLFLGLSVSGSTAKTNQDLSKWFDNISVAGGAGTGGYGTYSWGNSAHGPVKVLTGGFAVAQTPGAAVTFGASYTWVTQLFNIGSLFGSTPANAPTNDGLTPVVTSIIRPFTQDSPYYYAPLTSTLVDQAGSSADGGDNKVGEDENGSCCGGPDTNAYVPPTP